MYPVGGSTGVAITNPLVLYRALIATQKISPDSAQHRLALHLQKLYERLKDYEPTVDYSHKLNELNRIIGNRDVVSSKRLRTIGNRGIWGTLFEQKQHRDTLALTRTLSSREAAISLQSPKGLMLHGEVGTGKSMLIDLFADCLPNRKKRRCHFNTFMLETLARLEDFRRARRLTYSHPSQKLPEDDYSLLWLAREMIQKSPILFLDEFQLPDRAASKIMANLMTSFFQLGGVLVATSNRMPEELDKAAGMAFATQPSKMASGGWKLGFTKVPPAVNLNEYGDFLEVLKARCEVWQMEGHRDYRRSEYEALPSTPQNSDPPPESTGSYSRATSFTASSSLKVSDSTPQMVAVPPHYFDMSDPEKGSSTDWEETFTQAELAATGEETVIPWTEGIMRVYGRNVVVPRQHKGVTSWTFDELCGSRLGPADYLTLASKYHTLILTDIPIITLSQKSEARRLINLLDALYEARCKLLVTAAAAPDDIFFPEAQSGSGGGQTVDADESYDAVYAETFSEAYQDVTTPFRPNISSYNPSSLDEPDYTHARLAGVLSDDALEDDPPNRMRRMSATLNDEDALEGLRKRPNFNQVGVFTGEDEKFAYKRARSRLWEMCGARWWARQEEGWWKPLAQDVRSWERSNTEELKPADRAQEPPGVDQSAKGEGVGIVRDVDEQHDEVMFRHGASPFRTSAEPPPKIGWTHIWGTVKWGKRAGSWGQGVEGLADRKKKDDEDK